MPRGVCACGQPAYSPQATNCENCNFRKHQRGSELHAPGIQRRAHSLVWRAVKRGDLPRPETLPCSDCGQRASLYDHRDYSRPLHVWPVCAKCNSRRGPAQKVAA